MTATRRSWPCARASSKQRSRCLPSTILTVKWRASSGIILWNDRFCAPVSGFLAYIIEVVMNAPDSLEKWRTTGSLEALRDELDSNGAEPASAGSRAELTARESLPYTSAEPAASAKRSRVPTRFETMRNFLTSSKSSAGPPSASAVRAATS